MKCLSSLAGEAWERYIWQGICICSGLWWSRKAERSIFLQRWSFWRSSDTRGFLWFMTAFAGRRIAAKRTPYRKAPHRREPSKKAPFEKVPFLWWNTLKACLFGNIWTNTERRRRSRLWSGPWRFALFWNIFTEGIRQWFTGI